ncbi:MAG TPA: hypothetical protein PKD09_17255 [Aggregatilinea sp.]|jgi:hypothetical protein|uniref:hypothetical protein n=1 Tax=Aggregatilinea sp. TaxID=2806333 RepID=UPI002CA0EDC1|nr:hypothetical protein [Aggregatilinea sp.]HML23407.1 hypothetical protein [Aggregatilinea sp.]
MAMQIEQVPGEPIIIVHFTGWVEPLEVVDPMLEKVVAFKRETQQHVYRILDFSQAQLDFGEMVQGMGSEVNREGGSNDPDVTTMFVVSDDLHKLGVQSIQQQDQYGKAPVSFFMSCDEAVAYAKTDAAAK